VTWPKDVGAEERSLCELSYAHNVRRSYNVEVCNFVVTEPIRNAGAYLRALTERAKGGQYSLGPMLMALLPVSITRSSKSA
jgi:Replication protein C C-terminal region